MNRLLITLVFLSTLFAAKAQKVTSFYYLKTGEPTWPKAEFYSPSRADSAEADSYRVEVTDTTQANQYTVRDFYADGKLKMIGTANVTLPDFFPKLEGYCIGFFNNGKRMFMENCHNGHIIDIIKYYPAGKIYMKGRYDGNGIPHLEECYDMNGDALAQNGKGKWLKYNDDFSKITSEGQIEEGLPIGDWYGQLNDTLKIVEHYKNGLLYNGECISLSGKKYHFDSLITNARFVGELKDFYKFVSRHYRYPYIANQKNIQGKVFVAFTVEKDGAVTNAKVLRGPGYGIEEEALRVINLAGNQWIPALKYGVIPTRSQYTLPIDLSLRDLDPPTLTPW